MNTTPKRQNAHLPRRTAWVSVPVLLLILLSRAIHFGAMQMHWDEVWAIWQTFGSPADILAWTPHDWSPLYFLVLGAWRSLVGIHPVVLRLLSIYLFMLSAACLYRFARRVWDVRAALLSTLAYAALGYGVYFSMMVRGYALMLALVPPALWLAVRYFERPGWRRAAALALCLAAMFYVQTTSVFAFAAIGAATLAMYGAAVLRWWRPVLLLAALALPEIINKGQLAAQHVGAITARDLPPFGRTIERLFKTYAGEWPGLWLALMLGALALLLARRRLDRRALGVGVWVLAPVLLYAVQPVVGVFRYEEPRYYWWVIPGAALWVGCGWSMLPRWWWLLATPVLAVAMFLPVPLNVHRDVVFETVAEHWQAGDVMLVDPNCGNCPAPEEWDYFTRVYFPQGITFVSDPAGYRRVWYVREVTKADPEVKAAVFEGRVPGKFVGPPTFFARLFEGPPDPEGVLFDNGLRFHGMEVVGASSPEFYIKHEGEPVRVRLWWSADRPVELDYSLSVAVMDQGAQRLYAQDDGPVNAVRWNEPAQVLQTSQLAPGEFYIDERTLTLLNPMPTGVYRFFLVVYQSWDGVRVAAPGVNDATLLPLAELAVKSW